MKIYFVTSNKNKVKEVQKIMGGKHEIIQIELEYPELRSDYPEEVARLAAKQLADKLNKALFVEDSGLFIKALNGFPGTCSSYIHQRIGLKGIIKLMEGVKDREAMYISAVAYCEPRKQSVSFLGTEKGKIASKIRGSYGFGHDPIFIPEGSKKTYGEMGDTGKVKRFRRKAVLKLLEYLEK